MNTRKLGMKFACLLVGGSMLLSGNCVPKRFWANTWAATLGSAANTAVDTFVLQPFRDAVAEAGADEE